MLSHSARPLQKVARRVPNRLLVDSLDPSPDNNDDSANVRGWFDENDEPNTYRMLSTLHPKYLTTADFTIISNSRYPVISFPPNTLSVVLRFFKKDGVCQPFPPNTRGFFYYNVPAEGLPAMAGGLRFRITPTGRPSSFNDGHDLLLDGLPWELPFTTIAYGTGRKVILREHLINEGFFTQADVDKYCAIMPVKKRLDHKITIYRLGQPFPVHFQQGLHLWIAGEKEFKPWVYGYMFTDCRMQYRPRVRPYTGSALARFELSTLPEHADSRTVIMRIVKMLNPPICVDASYDGHLPVPAEGEIFRRSVSKGSKPRIQPWSCDVDVDASDSAAALRMLVEVFLFFFSSSCAQDEIKQCPDVFTSCCVYA
ncbi:hypothetical protein R3P38DRAFT_3239278 [Favolaschia claudopus]|uniref:Uncharacterized protein n=1 Tax=Favolaschia claudopus TaxID=2862362 RepID=A0AAV9Z897_9AGAR